MSLLGFPFSAGSLTSPVTPEGWEGVGGRGEGRKGESLGASGQYTGQSGLVETLFCHQLKTKLLGTYYVYFQGTVLC